MPPVTHGNALEGFFSNEGTIVEEKKQKREAPFVCRESSFLFQRRPLILFFQYWPLKWEDNANTKGKWARRALTHMLPPTHPIPFLLLFSLPLSLSSSLALALDWPDFRWENRVAVSFLASFWSAVVSPSPTTQSQGQKGPLVDWKLASFAVESGDGGVKKHSHQPIARCHDRIERRQRLSRPLAGLCLRNLSTPRKGSSSPRPLSPTAKSRRSSSLHDVRSASSRAS